MFKVLLYAYIIKIHFPSRRITSKTPRCVGFWYKTYLNFETSFRIYLFKYRTLEKVLQKEGLRERKVTRENGTSLVGLFYT